METSQSPIILKKAEPTMTFPQAMEKVIEGKSITRLEWGDKQSYAFLSELTNMLMINNTVEDPQKNVKKGLHTWIVCEGDMKAADWVVVEKRNWIIEDVI